MALTKVIGAGAEGLTLSSTDLKIDAGDLVFSTAAKGVVLGATSNTDANTLDDYEEGTWTPTYGGVTTNPTITYSIQVGSYRKVGNIVHITGRIRTDATSGGDGNLLIKGLPFTSQNVANSYGIILPVHSTSWAADHFPSTHYIPPNQAQIFCLTNRSSDARDGLGDAINCNNLTNGTSKNDVIFGGSYYTE